MLVTKERIDIDRQQVLRSIGYGTDCKLPTRLASLVDDYVENVHNLIEPSYSCVVRDINLVQDSRVIIDGSIIFESKVIASLLEQCEKAAVFLVTIGEHLEEMAYRLVEDGLIVQATVLDAIGSVAAEGVADFVQGRVREIADDRGLVISQRFSPGCCDWDICQQRRLFWAVGGDSMGIHLTDGCLMIPRKSISGIIGIGPRDGNVENCNPCKTCDKHNCHGRRGM
ncbi:MAG: hypothetical protein V3S69_04980 [Dehalococcoidales bacterium]|nr:hypothetical protein [Dehalococcoidales bacterium]